MIYKVTYMGGTHNQPTITRLIKIHHDCNEGLVKKEAEQLIKTLNGYLSTKTYIIEKINDSDLIYSGIPIEEIDCE